MRVCAVLSVLLVLVTISLSEPQQNGFQSLSYPEGAQIQPVRPPTTVPPLVEATTKKSGFFGGIRNFFSGKKEDQSTPTPLSAVTPSTTSTTTSTTKRPTAKEEFPSLTPQRNPAIPVSSTSTTTTSTTTTRRPPSFKEDFPALGPANRNQPAPASPLTPSTPPSAWNRPISIPSSSTQTPTPSNVRFIPQNPPQPPNPGYTTKVPSSTPAGHLDAVNEVLQLSEDLFAKDTSNLNRFVTANYQKQTVSYSTQDDAPAKFLTVDDDKLGQVSTVSKMKALYNNYELDTSINEHSTALEKNEENDFIDAVLATNVNRALMLFLQKKDKITADPKTHKELLKTIWFTQYSRGQGKIGSSGFEHVFMAENKNNSIIGLHNWIYLNQMEKADKLDYKGWLKKVEFGDKGAVAKIRFSYDTLNKPVNGVFVGTSPELELSLYTLCFEMFPDGDCLLSYNGKQFKVRTYTFRYRGKRVVGSAYPEVI